MAATGSRLNSAGADVRRRLTTRGRNAMRLRQVLALGRGTEGGDPLLDLRPVWMASPETVAQIFSRGHSSMSSSLTKPASAALKKPCPCSPAPSAW